MRTTLFLLLLLCAAMRSLAQSHGISYQAVILTRADNITEIPGVDVPGGDYLPDQALDIRFTILDEAGAIEYQETHSTSTDRFGLISLIIGDGSMTNASPDVFEEINWDGTAKDLRVEVNIPPPAGYGEYMEFSLQKLVFAPYAFHRNITATGTMIIDGATTLNSSLLVANGSPTWLTGSLTVDSCLYLHDCLVVDGTTDLNNGLDVNLGTPTNLSGTLNVDGAATLNSSLDVDGAATLNYTLEVDGASTLNSTLDVDGSTTLNSTLDVDGATTLNHTLDVDGASTLNNTLDVDGATTLNSTLDVDGASLLHSTLQVLGQTTIHAEINGDESDFSAYPLRVEGSKHGLAVKVNATDMDGTTNFITFFDGTGTARGRVEGQNAGEVALSPDYIYENAILVAEVAIATGGVIGSSTSSTVCAGAGACVTAPIPSLTISSAAELVIASANLAAYQAFAYTNLGVTYESGSADYAEWLERADPAEVMSFGDIVAVKGGRISKNTRAGAERYMVISLKPAVLGNMPGPGKEHLYEKVGFMGQVPVKVIGPVHVGDYILPSGFNDGLGRAVSPDAMTLQDHAQIVGVAWSASEEIAGYVNVAIGLNNNDLVAQMTRQQTEIDELRAGLRATQDAVKQLLPGFDPDASGAILPKAPAQSSSYENLSAEEMHPPVDREVIDESLDLLRAQLEEAGMNVNEHPVYGPVLNDPIAREAFIDRIVQMADVQRLRMIEIDRRHGFR